MYRSRVADGEDGRHHHVATTGERSQAREQLVEGERLDEIVVGAGVESRDAIDDRVACRQHENRHLETSGTQRARHGDAVTMRKHVIEHHGVVLVQRGVLHGVVTVGDEIDRVSALAEAAREHRPQLRIVLDNQQSHQTRVRQEPACAEGANVALSRR